MRRPNRTVFALSPGSARRPRHSPRRRSLSEHEDWQPLSDDPEPHCEAGKALTLDARLEERLRERERIARELHDTLLQGAQALIIVVNTWLVRMQPGDPMRDLLTDTLRRAETLMTQGRDRIQNLRDASSAAVNLPQYLADAWRDLGGKKEFRIVVEGRSRELDPVAGDEIALIAREALTNALYHSKAKAVEAQITFDDDVLKLCVCDDGVGLGDEILRAGSLTGHWGLSGIRERSLNILANLIISSDPGVGTRIELAVPASSAYASKPRPA